MIVIFLLVAIFVPASKAGEAQGVGGSQVHPILKLKQLTKEREHCYFLMEGLVGLKERGLLTYEEFDKKFSVLFKDFLEIEEDVKNFQQEYPRLFEPSFPTVSL